MKIASSIYVEMSFTTFIIQFLPFNQRPLQTKILSILIEDNLNCYGFIKKREKKKQNTTNRHYSFDCTKAIKKTITTTTKISFYT